MLFLRYNLTVFHHFFLDGISVLNIVHVILLLFGLFPEACILFGRGILFAFLFPPSIILSYSSETQLALSREPLLKGKAQYS